MWRLDISIQTRVVMALVGGLSLRLIQHGVIPLSDVMEAYDAALTALEGFPHDEETAQLRSMLEHAASGIAARASDQDKHQ
jgi:hypothetical protein